MVYYNKDIKFLSKDYIDIALKTSRYIRKFKKHDMVFKVTISIIKDYFLFITLTNSHSMIGTSQI